MTTKGTIFDVKKYAIHDGPGIRTTIFFKGCPLDCWWCHNPEGKKPEPETIIVKTDGGDSNSPASAKKEIFGRVATVDSVMEEIKKDVIFYDQSGGGVTFSGGEPMMQVDFLCTLLRECKKNGIRTAVDTSGYAPFEEFEKIYDLVDCFLYDLKLIDDEAHQEYTGVSNKLILANMRDLSVKGGKTEPRIAMIPGITDTEENLEALAGFLATLGNIRQVCLLPYNKLGEDKFTRFNIVNRLGCLRTQTKAEMDGKAKQFRSCGYRVRIGG